MDVPASIPEVTSVGGSEFTGDGAGAVTGTTPNTVAGATTFWGGSTGTADTISSALSYIPEMAWNDTVAGLGIFRHRRRRQHRLHQAGWQTALTPPTVSATSLTSP